MLIGNATSARDLLRDFSPVAKEVHQAIRGSDVQFKKLENHNNCWQHPMVSCLKIYIYIYHFSNSFGIGNLKIICFLMNNMFLQIECTHKDGKVVFQDGSYVYVSSFIVLGIGIVFTSSVSVCLLS